jgi:hypothetical protein
MEMLLRGAMGVFIVLSAESAFGVTLDPMWMFTDSNRVIHIYFMYCDTARNIDKLCYAQENDQLPDTGVSYDGSKYINFDYQFSSDSFFVRNEFDSTKIIYRDKRPGYAGFKTLWDYGLTGFPLSRYKYLIFAHKGPNMNHMVTVRCWYNDGTCGSPSFNDLIGTFAASNTWKVDTLAIPESIQNKPDKERNFDNYYEFVFIINNLDPNDTTSGPRGNFKVDEIKLVGCNPIDTSPKPQVVNEGQSATFQVYTSRAESTDTLTYQWKKDGADIAGANNAVYTITSAKPTDTGVYTVAVKVSSTSLTFTSQSATLTVHANDAIQPGIFLKNSGKNAFSIHSETNGNVLITSWASMKTPVTISLYSVDGRTLIDRTSRTFEAGNNTCILGNKVRGKGIYLVKITGASINFSKQVVVAR